MADSGATPTVARERSSRWDTFLLFGLEHRGLDLLLTAGLTVFLLWSRLALLASGPWEWDETIFARGVFDFDLLAHFPHPPGFPGWIAIGHLLLPVAGTPLKALELGSALLSVAALWPLVSLGRRVAPPVVAVAAAALVLLLPGPWLHAVRGFSSTPATTFALFAAALLAGGLAGRRVTAFTLLVAAAFLIRPILLPGLGLLWLGGALTVRPLRRLVPGVVAAVTAGIVSLVMMVHAQGSWQLFVLAFEQHAHRHFSRLVDNPGGVLDLGLLHGAGGLWWAVALVVLSVLGLIAWGRRMGRRAALLWAMVLGITVLQLVFLQNRTYTRYAVPVHLALAPLLAAGAAAAAPPAIAAVSLGGLAFLAGSLAWPLLVEQHVDLLPGWRAVDVGFDVARRNDVAVVTDGGLYPFANYRWFLEGHGIPAEHPELFLSPWDPDFKELPSSGWVVVTDHEGWHLPPLWGRTIRWGPPSQELLPYTQGRFLEAAMIPDPPLLVGQWWAPEHTSSGERFVWGGRNATLALPPLPAGTRVIVELRPAHGPAPLDVELNGTPATKLPGDAPRTTLWLGPEGVRSDGVNRIVFRRTEAYPPGDGDQRPLSVKLLGVRIAGPAFPWTGRTATAAARRRLGVELEGAWKPERFGRLGSGCWLHPTATLLVPAGSGTLRLHLAAPRPKPAEVTVRIGKRLAAGPVTIPPHGTWLPVPVLPGDGRGGTVEVELRATPFNPAREGRGTDRRDLGVVLLEISFDPAQRLDALLRPVR